MARRLHPGVRDQGSRDDELRLRQGEDRRGPVRRAPGPFSGLRRGGRGVPHSRRLGDPRARRKVPRGARPAADRRGSERSRTLMRSTCRRVTASTSCTTSCSRHSHITEAQSGAIPRGSPPTRRSLPRHADRDVVLRHRRSLTGRVVPRHRVEDLVAARVVVLVVEEDDREGLVGVAVVQDEDLRRVQALGLLARLDLLAQLVDASRSTLPMSRPVQVPLSAPLLGS